MPFSKHWPVGSSLRFTAEVANLPDCGALAGTPVIVLTPPRSMPIHPGDGRVRQIQQKVYAFAAKGECWVQARYLVPIPFSMLLAYRSRRWPVRKP